MKRFLIFLLAALIGAPAIVHPVAAAPLGSAAAAFENARPDKNETAWGRLVADALRLATSSDIAIVNASGLRRGTLKAGDISADDINALLAFPDDEVVSMTITGAQLRAALERAVQAYPVGSPAFLHSSGFVATFNAQAPVNRRITMVRVEGREVEDADAFSVVMPVSLAEGGAGYYTIWPNWAKGHDAKSWDINISQAISSYVRAKREVAPDAAPRLAMQ